jgi:hypothetical protein
MSPENRPMHSMLPREHELALEVLVGAWERLRGDLAGSSEQGESRPSIMAAVKAEVEQLTARHPDVEDEFAEHIGLAAVWYLDRGTRRVGDPDRDGLTAAQRAVNLAVFNQSADAAQLERLFAIAVALNVEDI